ncbi:MAG: galactokinase [Erysipelotrichaceae bacterium]|nr:galactokinase [Erysipelotrichaceae bacterium]
MINEKKVRFIHTIKGLKTQFNNAFKEEPTDVFSSPGRIELLGNHTDHNHGKVLVSSVNLNILALTRKRDDGKVVYHAKGYRKIKININDLSLKESEYGKSDGLIRGVLFKMKELGYNIGGVEISSKTTIFKGAGVSSSAAFEVLIAKVINYYYNEDKIDAMTIAKIAQFAECVYFNKPCGLLDQSGISLGGVNYIDFKSVEEPIVKTMQFNVKKYDIVLTNCVDSHDKLTYLYSKIKEDMALLSNYFNKEYLRQVRAKEFFEKKEELIDKFGLDVFNRGKHYFEENKRVEQAYKCILNNDEDGFVKCINDSGESSFYQLKNCYVNSIEENLPQGILKSKEYITSGSVRVHGGGFAGTILAFVNKKETKEYISKMKEMFGEHNVKQIYLAKYGTRHIGKIENILEE